MWLRSWKHLEGLEGRPGGRLEGLKGELGYHSTACRRVRREEDGKKPNLMKKWLDRICKMAAEPRRWGSC